VIDLRSEQRELVLMVKDNGKGIDDEAISSHHAMGLLGMRERAIAFGGTAEVTSATDGGTLVRVRIPVERS
jgi:signal transduction histidine kinase